MTVDKFKIPVSMLSPAVDPTQLGFDDTSELEPLNEIIGQERAVEALEFGLQMKGPASIFMCLVRSEPAKARSFARW